MTSAIDKKLDKIGNIDLVYLWVDGNDPQWQAKRAVALGDAESKSSANCEGRYANHDELLYSLRSIEKYAPWIHNIFIVTDNQTPKWLNLSNPKIHIIDHREILPAECIPCFNSSVIEHFLADIPGLSEHFLFSNDDMYLNKPTTPEDFFTSDGLPIVRLKKRHFRKLWIFIKDKILHTRSGLYSHKLDHSAAMIEKTFGKYYQGKPHHNIDAFLVSHFKKIRQLYIDDIYRILNHHKREYDDVHRSIYSYGALADNMGKVKYVDDAESMKISLYNKKAYGKLDRLNPIFFCMNDSEHSKEEDRQYAAAFLARRFPEKSSFEL